jgi:hypothetical protein
MNIKNVLKNLSKKRTKTDIVISNIFESNGINSLCGSFDGDKKMPITDNTYKLYADIIDHMYFGIKTYDETSNNSLNVSPESPISSAKYSAMQINKIKQVPLLRGFFNKPSNRLKMFLELQSVALGKPSLFYDSNLNFVELLNSPLSYETGISGTIRLYISDVRKIDSNYIGDLTVHTSEYIGAGTNMRKSSDDLEISIEEAFKPVKYKKSFLMERIANSFWDQNKFFNVYVKNISSKDNCEIKRILTIYKS